MITLVAIICSGFLCKDVVIPTELMVAGKVGAEIPMPYTEVMCRTHGLIDALDWLKDQEQYKGWTLRPPIQCVPGKYVSPKRA